MMHEIMLIHSRNNLIKLELDDHFFQGEHCHVVIRCGNYKVRGELWITFNELRRFYDALQSIYRKMIGTAVLYHADMALTIEYMFDLSGNLKINGKYKENPGQGTELLFRMISEHYHVEETLRNLKNLFEDYSSLKLGVQRREYEMARSEIALCQCPLNES